jgi:hypothetical protein
MKTPESIKTDLLKMSEDDARNIKLCVEELNAIQGKRQIGEDTIKKLTNLITTLDSMRDNYYWRLLRASKQNHMID